MVSEGEFQAASGQGAEDKFKEETGHTLREMYQKYHPQVLADFEDEMPKYWGRKWKANTNVGKLRMVLVHRPGKEFLSVGNPTPWPPHDKSLGAWRMSFKPDLDELIEHYENLVDAYKAEGVEVGIVEARSKYRRELIVHGLQLPPGPGEAGLERKEVEV